MRFMPLGRYTLRQMEAFVAVADLRNFGAAGERLGLTAQAVSQGVAELEAVLGFKLFDRTTRRVDLAGGGRAFLASAQSVVRQSQAAESAAADVRNRSAGVVRVGAPMVLASLVLPRAISAYTAGKPNVAVRIHDLAVDRLVDAVASGLVDIAVGPDRAVGRDVMVQPLFDSRWVLWCVAGHVLARRRLLRWAELREVPLVAAGRDHERSVAQMRLSAPDEARITPVEVVDNISTALGIAAQGKAATLAPAYVAVLARQFGLVQRRVIEPETIRKVCLYTPGGERSLAPAAVGFAEHLAGWLPRWHRASRSG